MLRKVRIIPDLPIGDLWRSALGWGVLGGLTFALIEGGIRLASALLDGGIGLDSVVFLASLIATFVPFPAFAAWSSCQTFRTPRHIGVNLIFFAGWFAGASVNGVYQQVSFPNHPLNFSLGSLVLIAVGIAGISIQTFVVRLIVHNVVFRAVRHTGEQCLICAYSREGLAPDALCPECGTPPGKLPASRGRFHAYLSRIAPRFALGCFVLGFAAYGVRWWNSEWDTRRAMARIGCTEFTDVYTLFSAPSGSLPRAGGFLPLGVLDRGILVVCEPDTGTRKASLHLVTLHRPLFRPPMPMEMSQPVSCLLNDDQTAALFAGGVPASLLDEFKRQAAAAKPTTVTKEGFGTSSWMWPTGSAVRLRAEDYFRPPL